MKKTIIIIIGMLVAVATTFAQEKVDLKVTVTGIVKGKGVITISVFDSEDNWLRESVKSVKVDLTKVDTEEFIIKDLIKGSYALSVIQDENKNGELDMGMMGPEEGYGFSNNAMGMFGPPKFSEAVMAIQSNISTTVNLH